MVRSPRVSLLVICGLTLWGRGVRIRRLPRVATLQRTAPLKLLIWQDLRSSSVVGQSVLLDTCVAINLIATDDFAAIRRVLDMTFLMADQAAAEMGYLRDEV